MKNIDEKTKKIVALIDGAATEGEARAASCCFRASANAAENCFRAYCARMKAMGYGNVSRQKGVKGTWMLGFISGLKRAYSE